ncbi:MAG TPA: GNAT family N-acetyltransferase [Trinickia sp.]|jgi:GNAT superfamily N-acetyltransferase|uniref:GNAT family N-acetyltransferase n=1 Tax=Trinickia sp. TaxID=2571163 RepID=UPI002B8D055D|nr:GNAT family N-acetyltransferase [Trinickia sp.]HTI17364.1 GNAT family N-acetyltransferase [Trinickia sp.]
MEKSTVESFEASSPTTLPSRVEASQTGISLRASTLADRDFLMGVFESTRIDEFRASGLDEQTIRDLLAHQFSMQDTYYRRHYPNARFDVVLNGERAIGRLYHEWNSNSGEALIIDISLLSAYRGAGIGTRLMKAVVAEAARREMAVRIQTEFNNPARALYRRLGFERIGDNGVYEQLRRAAAPFANEEVTPVAGLSGNANE